MQFVNVFIGKTAVQQIPNTGLLFWFASVAIFDRAIGSGNQVIQIRIVAEIGIHQGFDHIFQADPMTEAVDLPYEHDRNMFFPKELLALQAVRLSISS